jgi:hypothetical protein
MANQVLYGFHNLRDLLTERVTDSNIGVVNQAIDDTLAEHNRQMAALLSLFVTETTEFKRRFVSAKNKRLQPLDEVGRARPTKRAGYYEVAWPIQDAGDAFGVDYVTRVKMTIQEVNNWLAETIIADKRWMRDHILSALFTNVTWTYPDQLHGDLTIQPLANNDGVLYNVMSGADAGAQATHHIGQANAIGAGADNPYPVLQSLLMNHPENGGTVVALIPSGLRATTEALATFHTKTPDALTLGSGSTQLTGTLGVTVPGRVLGYEESDVWVVEWPSMPANYIIAVATEGERPLAMRQHPEPELQGFKRIADRDDHPWYEAQYARRAGFGAWNRVGAAVIEISDASYDIPTNYAAPMP